jgi:membrane protease YdiL (CAAX protease family)
MPPLPPPEPAPRWGLGDAALGMLVGVLLSSLAGSIWLGATGQEELSLGGMALSQVGLWVGLAGAAVWASRRKGRRRLALDFGARMRPFDVPVGVVVGVAAQFGLVRLVALLLSPLVGRPDLSGPTKRLVDEAHGPGLVLLVVFVAVGAPVVEELFFRGLLLRALQRRVPDGAAVAVSAVLFGVAHVQDLAPGALLVVIVSLVALGAVLATLAVRTGRLGPGMWTHAAFNASTLVALLLR